MQIIKTLKKQMLKMAFESQHGHVASSFSCIDILYVLYNNVMNITPDNYEDSNSDKFILSKGHACLALYVILEQKGFITKEDLSTFCKSGTILSGHPNKDIPGVICNTGSLGHGLGIATGIALSKKINGNSGNVYCLLGDEESMEGTTFECMTLINNYNLDNLYVIIDQNSSAPINLRSLAQKFEVFGLYVENIIGHNHYDLKNTLSLKINKPKCLIACNTKGNGIKRMEEDSQAWHHRKFNKKEYYEMLEELS